MNHKIPSYIENRIRKIPPPNLNIVSGSTPVVAFGDLHQARVATLGFNPSKQEFLDRKGVELTESKRRLETFNSLRIVDIKDINCQQVEQVWETCKNYFTNGNSYNWFKKFDKILEHFGVSYYSGTACHLDLVQWATNPVWGKLSRQNKIALLSEDRSFLNEQLTNERIEILLLNGISVVDEFQNAFECTLNECAPLEENRLTSKIYQGYFLEKIKVIGWSINLQSSFGVTNTFIEKITKQL